MDLFLLIASCFFIVIQSSNSELTKNLFTINTDSNWIEIVNGHRTAASKLKLSIVGAKITNHTDKNYGTSLRLNMSDHSEMYIDQLSYKIDTEYSWHQIAWTGLVNSSNLGREFCLHWACNNASWFPTYENLRKWPTDFSELSGLTQPTSLTTGPQFGSIVEYLFINSDGFALMLFDWDAWYLRVDRSTASDPKLCFSSQNLSNRDQYSLVVHLLTAKNIREVHRYTHNRSAWLPTPKYHNRTTPDENMFRHPIWSIKSVLNQSKIIEFGTEIKKNGFAQIGQLEFQFQWESHYGDLSFDTGNFPDPKIMIQELHKLGFKVSLAIHPFVSSKSTVFKENGHFFSVNKTDQKLLHVKYHDQNGGIIDFSNANATKWFASRLKKLQEELSIDSFNLEGGELGSYESAQLNSEIVREKPNLMSTRYAYLGSQFGGSVVMDSAFRDQDLPNLVRLSGKEINWSAENGLRSLIRTALTLSIGGYSFLLPDADFQAENRPSEELYIRWMQAISLFPSMHISLPPWSYANETVLNITRKLTQLHTEHAPVLIALAKLSSLQGEPIIRPLWYAAPDDPRSYSIDDQFLVGDNILVAPVLEQNQRERNIFFPASIWLDQHGKEFQGPGVFKIAAPLEELPFFQRKV